MRMFHNGIVRIFGGNDEIQLGKILQYDGLERSVQMKCPPPIKEGAIGIVFST